MGFGARMMVAALVAVAVLASGCSGEDDGATSSAVAAAEPLDSPLSNYLGFDRVSIDPETSDEQIAAEDRQIEATVEACMVAAGYEYTPEDIPVEDYRLQPDGLAPGSDEWVAKYGLGVSTLAFPQELVGDLLGFVEIEEDADLSPNEVYIESLSDLELEAYYAALYGDEDESATVSPGGCYEEAYSDLSVAPLVDFYVQFNEDLNSVFAQLDSHPLMLEHQAEVAECLAEAGVDQASRADIEADIDEQMLPLYELAYENAADDEEPDFSELTGQLAEIQAEEIRLAQVVDECGDSELAFRELKREIVKELEEQFIEDNKDRLDAFLESVDS